MRRAILILLGALALALVAGPALATESHESEPAHGESEVMTDESGHESDDSAAFGEGDWDGLLAAGAVAAVFGLVVFAFSNIGVKDEPAEDAHH